MSERTYRLITLAAAVSIGAVVGLGAQDGFSPRSILVVMCDGQAIRTEGSRAGSLDDVWLVSLPAGFSQCTAARYERDELWPGR